MRAKRPRSRSRNVNTRFCSRCETPPLPPQISGNEPPSSSWPLTACATKRSPLRWVWDDSKSDGGDAVGPGPGPA